jgi:hypothetical protein
MTIYKEDGLKIRNFIEKTLKLDLPKSGFLAGQSICSALLYLKGKQKDFFVNDLDIFLKTDSLSKLMKEKANKKNDSLIHTMTGISGNLPNLDLEFNQSTPYFNINDKEKYLIEQKKNKIIIETKKIEFLKKLKKFGISNTSISLDYEHASKNSLQFSLDNKFSYFSNINLDFKMSKTKKIFTTLRKDLFNYIYLDETYDFKFSAMNVLNDFDINCTQVGIDLNTNKIYYTNDFLYFYNTLNMKISTSDTPYHTVIRYFKKAEEFPHFNFSKEFESYYIHNQIKFGIFSKDKKFQNANKITKYGFGNIYLKKYEKTKIKDYFNLNKMKEEKEEFLNKMKNRFPNKKIKDYDLYTLSGRCDDFSYIKNGEHKKDLEKSLGVDITSGYLSYLHIFMRQIIENKNKNKTSILITNTKKLKELTYNDLNIEKELIKNKNKILIHYKNQSIKEEELNFICENYKILKLNKYYKLFQNFNDLFVFSNNINIFKKQDLLSQIVFNSHKPINTEYTPVNLIKSFKNIKTRKINSFNKDNEVIKNTNFKEKTIKENVLYEITETKKLNMLDFLLQKPISIYKEAIKAKNIRIISFSKGGFYYGCFILNDKNKIISEYKNYLYDNEELLNEFKRYIELNI